MAVTPDRLRELSPVEKYIFNHSKLSEVTFKPEDNVRAYTYSYALRNFLIGGNPKINGFLPEQGKGLVVADHMGGADIFIMHLLPILTANRTIRLVAKGKLVNPDDEESDAMQKRRRKKGPFRKVISALGIDKMVNRHIAAPYSRAFRVISMNMGSAVLNRSSFNEIREELADGNLIGVFPTGTRKPPLDLLDALPLAAKIAVNDPVLPVIPVCISGCLVNIGESITFKQVLEEQNITSQLYTRDAIKLMSRVIIDKIGQLAPDESLFPAWWLERQGLFSERQLRLMAESDVDLKKIFMEAKKSSELEVNRNGNSQS